MAPADLRIGTELCGSMTQVPGFPECTRRLIVSITATLLTVGPPSSPHTACAVGASGHTRGRTELSGLCQPAGMGT